MERLSSTTLTDPAYSVVPGPPGDGGVAWLRAHVPRFCDGPAHARRRAMTAEVVACVQDAPFNGTPTRSLLVALGLSPGLEAEVAQVATAYQPHAPQSRAADAAADRLLEVCGGRTEQSAARVCVLVQAHTATLSLIDSVRSGSDAPPVPSTRRVDRSGVEVEVGLDDAPFGRGAHRCPGERLALRLAREALS